MTSRVTIMMQMIDNIIQTLWRKDGNLHDKLGSIRYYFNLGIHCRNQNSFYFSTEWCIETKAVLIVTMDAKIKILYDGIYIQNTAILFF